MLGSVDILSVPVGYGWNFEGNDEQNSAYG